VPVTPVASRPAPPALSITAHTYTHVLVDGREVDYEALLATSA
jgi:hypothetical protein